MAADEIFRPLPPIVFQCMNEFCEIYMFIPDNYSPCPVCATRGILVENISFTIRRPK